MQMTARLQDEKSSKGISQELSPEHAPYSNTALNMLGLFTQVTAVWSYIVTVLIKLMNGTLSDNDRLELFRNTADKMGLHDPIVEKDFGVCDYNGNLEADSSLLSLFCFTDGL